MKKEELFARLDRFLEEDKNVEEMFYPKQPENTRTIFDYGDIMAKEISFVPEESMSEKWLLNKTHIQKKPKSSLYNIDFESVVKFVFDHADKELFTTLDAIFFVYDEGGLDELYEYTGDEYALECIDLDECIGLLWYEKNIVIVNIGLIIRASEEIEDCVIPAAEHIEEGIITTIVHELRHLMVDTNYLLTEEECPSSECQEDAVEEYSRRFSDRFLLQMNRCFVEKASASTTPPPKGGGFLTEFLKNCWNNPKRQTSLANFS